MKFHSGETTLHRRMKVYYQDLYRSKGYTVQMERKFLGYIPDLLCTNNKEVLAIECERKLSLRKIINILNNAFEHVDRVIIAIPQKNISQKKQNALGEDPRVSVVSFEDDVNIRIKPKYDRPSRHINFRADVEVHKRFIKRCKLFGVTQSSVLRELAFMYANNEVDVIIDGITLPIRTR